MTGYNRILIVRLSAAGDVVHAMPAVAAIRNLMPDAEISWVVEPLGESLLNAFEAVDHVILLDRKTLNRDVKKLEQRLQELQHGTLLRSEGWGLTRTDRYL